MWFMLVGISIGFVMYNVNKCSVVFNLFDESDCWWFLDFVVSVDIVVDCGFLG